MSVSSLLPGVHRFTSAEYDRLVASGALEGLGVEFLDGLLVDVSPQGPEHARVVRRLTGLLGARLDLLSVQLPLAVGEGWTPEPDVALTRQDDPHAHPTTAALVVEVMVTSHVDDHRKVARYAAAGVAVCWLLDVPTGVAIVHTEPAADGYRSVRRLRGGDRLTLAEPPVDIAVAELLGDG